ncbi:MAG: hypothetical protein D6790_00820 [Caldilineae bacterium]|nr:MAG: hypothetical protein D6790_00820 [Caldilineae bacterium]
MNEVKNIAACSPFYQVLCIGLRGDGRALRAAIAETATAIADYMLPFMERAQYKTTETNRIRLTVALVAAANMLAMVSGRDRDDILDELHEETQQRLVGRGVREQRTRLHDKAKRMADALVHLGGTLVEGGVVKDSKIWTRKIAYALDALYAIGKKDGAKHGYVDMRGTSERIRGVVGDVLAAYHDVLTKVPDVGFVLRSDATFGRKHAINALHNVFTQKAGYHVADGART